MIKTIVLALSDSITCGEIEEFKKNYPEIDIKEIDVKEIDRIKFLEKGTLSECMLITDCVDWYLFSEDYKIPYLIYFHEGNRNCSFEKAKYGIETLHMLELQFLERVYQRFKGIPWKIIETKRCIVREITVNDVEALYEIYKDPKITEFTEDLLNDMDEEKEYTRQYIRTVYAFYEFGMWIIEDIKTGELIGRAGISCREGFEEPELGYVIGTSFQNKGYATEVCSAILKYAMEELGFYKIRALIQNGNYISMKLCGKLGFVFEKEVPIGTQVMKQYIWNVS